MNAILRPRLPLVSPGQDFSAQAGASLRAPGRRREAGATLVEFALVVMLLMVMVMGIVDFSRALYVYHFLDHAAKSATRWAAVNGYTCAQDNSCTYGATGSTTNDINTYITACGGAKGTTISCGATGGDIKSYVLGLVPKGINPSSVNVYTTWPVQSSSSSSDPSPPICSGAVSGLTGEAIPNFPGCTVQVRVTYPFDFVYPFVRNGTIMMSSTSQMVIAH